VGVASRLHRETLKVEKVRMATMCFAMWLQATDLAATHHTIMIFIGLIAVALGVIAIVVLAISVRALKAIKELSATADEMKVKVLPLLDEVMAISKTSRAILEDAAPKVKSITDNLAKTSDTLVETSQIARGTVEKIGVTVSDVNLRAQRQVVRVDGMVTAALMTTAEVAEAIGNGIRVPAQKLAVMVTQARVVMDGVLAKVRSMAARTPFGGGEREE
jgi:uncharacterized protein YoxC